MCIKLFLMDYLRYMTSNSPYQSHECDGIWKYTFVFSEGTISPTSSPAFDSLPDHNGCPELFDSNADYGASDKVSTDIDGASISLVWQCSTDAHLSRYCPQFEPQAKSNLGWILVGHW